MSPAAQIQRVNRDTAGNELLSCPCVIRAVLIEAGDDCDHTPNASIWTPRPDENPESIRSFDGLLTYTNSRFGHSKLLCLFMDHGATYLVPVGP